MAGQNYKKAMGALKEKKKETLAEHLMATASPKSATSQQTKPIVIGQHDQYSTESSQQDGQFFVGKTNAGNSPFKRHSESPDKSQVDYATIDRSGSINRTLRNPVFDKSGKSKQGNN